MPAKSRAQQRLMQAAEHGASFPMARKVRRSMSMPQMRDFAVGSERGKPQHVGVKLSSKAKAHVGGLPHPHRNLGKWLHKPK